MKSSLNLPYQLVLIAGPSGAGKSSLTRALTRIYANCVHLSLHHYFTPSPLAWNFMQWVQKSQSVDWKLVTDHLKLIEGGSPCYVPVCQWEGTHRKRVFSGGVEQHARAKLLTPTPKIVFIEGCLALTGPLVKKAALRIFIFAEESLLEERHKNRPNVTPEIHEAWLKHRKEGIRMIMSQKKSANLLINASGTLESQVEQVMAHSSLPRLVQSNASSYSPVSEADRKSYFSLRSSQQI